MTIDTRRMRLIAEAATPASWGDPEWGDPDGEWFSVGYWRAGDFITGGTRGDARAKANVAHVAAFDPPTVLTLLDEIDHLRFALGMASLYVSDEWHNPTESGRVSP